MYYPVVKENKATGLTYTLDPETFVYLPNLTVTVDERDIGIWGQKRKKYLKEEQPEIYMQMFDSHSLTDHLIEINKSAEKMMEEIETAMMKQEGVTEQLKATDQMEWVRRLNSIQARAEEIVLNNLIYT
ncbi:MAG: TnpV protein [Clostridia bacterium]|nr:TnpV protein [Clostridia bacterium]